MKNSPRPGKLRSFGIFLVVSALAGLLVAGLAIPGAALSSAVAIGVSSSMGNLPIELEAQPQAERSTVYLSDGSVLAQFYDENRVIVTLDQISPNMQHALLAIEDDRFYEHGALDFKGLANAIIGQLPGGNGRGGSTLTQQYVKQVLVGMAMAANDPEAAKEAQAPTISRKITEMRYAIGVEKKLTKDQILEYYLNIVYFGDLVYGVEAAAKHYFNTTAADLTLAQAAMLAGIVQTPSRNPVQQPEASIERRNVVLDRMLQLKMITQTQADEAKAETFDPSQVQVSKQGCLGTRYPFICDYVMRTLENNPALGATAKERAAAVKRGGYSIYTTIDPEKQDQAQAAVSNMIAPTDAVDSVVVEMQPKTGQIVTMAQNRTYGFDQSAGDTMYNYAVDNSMGGSQGFQPGSTMKPFTVAAALQKGIPPTKTYNAPYSFNPSNLTYQGCNGPVKWTQSVKNLSPSGEMNMYFATANSVNTYFVQLEAATGICPVAEMATDAGVKVALPTDDHPDLMSYGDYPAFTLGVAEVSPLSLATGYATLAADGVRCDPVIITEIKDRDGDAVSTPNGNCTQAIDASVAKGVNAITQGVFTIGTATNARLPDGRPAAGKSGTTDDMVANWFVGYTPEIVTVAMIAKDTNPYYAGYWAKHPNNLYGLRLDSGTYLAGTGSSTVAPYLWRPAMIAAVKDLPKTAFSSPPSSILHGKKMAMPKVTNTDPDADKATLEKAGFTVLTKDIYSDTVEAGGYISATCDGTVAGTCWLQYSKGPRPGSTPSASAPPVVNNPGSTQTTNKPQEPGAHETPN